MRIGILTLVIVALAVVGGYAVGRHDGHAAEPARARTVVVKHQPYCAAHYLDVNCIK